MGTPAHQLWSPRSPSRDRRAGLGGAEGARVEYSWDSTLTEWYENKSGGLEHGYTVGARPDGADGSLVFTLAVRGDLRPRVRPNGRDVRFVDPTNTPVLDYSGLAVVDAAGRSLPARFEVVNGGLQLSVDGRDAKYPLVIDPIAQQAYLKASNAEALDQSESARRSPGTRSSSAPTKRTAAPWG